MRILLFLPMLLGGLVLTALATPACPELRWVDRYVSAPGGDERAGDMAIDADGNAYVTGSSDGAFVTIKYAPDGTRLWTAMLREDGAVQGRAIAVDAAGDVYVTGGNPAAEPRPFDYSDVYTVKYNASGVEQWVARYSNDQHITELGVDVAVDRNGNAVVLVMARNIPNLTPDGTDDIFDYDFVTIKYGTTGKLAWERRYNGESDARDGATRLAVDAGGNSYVIGATEIKSAGTTRSDLLTLKYSPTGSLLWKQQVRGPIGWYSYPRDIALDAAGNVHVTGESGGDVVTAKYSPLGTQLWVTAFSGADGGWGELDLDLHGNVFVSRTAAGKLTTYKYSPAGAALWSREWPGGLVQSLGGIAVDDRGNLYVTHSVADGALGVTKYAPDGAQVWSKQYAEDRAYFDPVSIGVDPTGGVYVLATNLEDPGAIVTLRYAQGAD